MLSPNKTPHSTAFRFWFVSVVMLDALPFLFYAVGFVCWLYAAKSESAFKLAISIELATDTACIL